MCKWHAQKRLAGSTARLGGDNASYRSASKKLRVYTNRSRRVCDPCHLNHSCERAVAVGFRESPGRHKELQITEDTVKVPGYHSVYVSLNQNLAIGSCDSFTVKHLDMITLISICLSMNPPSLRSLPIQSTGRYSKVARNKLQNRTSLGDKVTLRMQPPGITCLTCPFKGLNVSIDHNSQTSCISPFLSETLLYRDCNPVSFSLSKSSVDLVYSCRGTSPLHSISH